MNDAMDRRARQEAAEMDRRARREMAEEDARLKQVQLDNQRTYQQGVIENQQEENRLRQNQYNLDKQKQDWVENPENPSNAQTDYYAEQARKLKLLNDQTVKDREDLDLEVARASAMDAYVKHIQKVIDGRSVDDASWQAEADELFLKARGGVTDPLFAVNPSTLANGEAFRQTLTDLASGREADREVVTNVIQNMLRSNNLRQVGQKASPENTPNAGGYNNGNWYVAEKHVNPDWSIVDNKLIGTVDVILKNDRGEVGGYQAPITMGRRGAEADAEGNMVSATPAAIELDSLIKAGQGYYAYANMMAPFREKIMESAKRQYELKNGKGSFAATVEQKIEGFKKRANDPELGAMPSPVAGLTNMQLAMDEQKLREHYQFEVLDKTPDSPRRRNQLDQVVTQTASRSEVTNIERVLGRKLTRMELLEIASYLNDKGVEDRAGFNAFRNRLTQRDGGEGSYEARSGMGIVQDAFNRGGLRSL